MAMISVAAWFDELLGDIDVNDARSRKMYPFDLRVGCVKMAAPRHERFDFVREMGKEQIDRVFNNKPFTTNELTFVFPERHMSVHEQQAFMFKVMQNPNIDQITSVDIITSSALLMSDFTRECIRILSWADDEKHSGRLSY